MIFSYKKKSECHWCYYYLEGLPDRNKFWHPCKVRYEGRIKYTTTGDNFRWSSFHDIIDGPHSTFIDNPDPFLNQICFLPFAMSSIIIFITYQSLTILPTFTPFLPLFTSLPLLPNFTKLYQSLPIFSILWYSWKPNMTGFGLQRFHLFLYLIWHYVHCEPSMIYWTPIPHVGGGSWLPGSGLGSTNV